MMMRYALLPAALLLGALTPIPASVPLWSIAAGLTVSAIAWKVNLSAEHLERLFKRDLGCTVFKYLHKVRIENAKQYLLD